MTGSAEPLSVLLVSNFYPPHVVGGAELVARRQALGLASRGHKVQVLAGSVSASQDDRASLEREQADGLQVYRLPLRSLDTSDSFFWPSAAMRLRSIMATERFDVVHFHNVIGLGANLIPEAAATGAAVFVTLHDYWGLCFKQTLLRDDGSLCPDTGACHECMPAIRPRGEVSLPIRLRRDYVFWALEHATMLISPSRALAHVYRSAGFAADRIAVQSNGIDPGSAAPPRDREPLPVRFLTLAHLGEHKGISDLLHAASLLARRRELDGRWRLDIAGEGALRTAIEKRIEEERLGDAVHLLGRIAPTEVLDRLTDTHVVMLPSRWPENEPVSLLEGMAAGCALIATDIGGNPELVDDGISGFLVPPSDPAALAAAMARYIADPELAARHGARSLRNVGALDSSRTIDRLEHFYRAGARAESAIADAPIVICGGGWPDLNAADICNYLHCAEGGKRIRLLWHKWAEPAAWRSASLVWNWSGDGDPSLIRRAVRAGIPILAPAGAALETALATGFGLARLYRSSHEAVSVLLGIGFPSGDTFAAARGAVAADLLALMSPRESFALPAVQPGD
jgi:glycosyltransferase involved in cell wall biosynthesis